jgi:outer membrane protein, multidrug efflux system
MRRGALLLCALLMTLSGCNLAPQYVRPQAPVPAAWPTPSAAAAAPEVNWHQLIGNEKMQSVVALALSNNRDLRASVATLASVRAQYHIQRSAQFPALTGSAGASITRGESSLATPDIYQAQVGISSFELDLFGRQRNLTKQAFEQYLSSEAGIHATRIALIGDTAAAFANLASQIDLLHISQDTLASATRSLSLTQALYSSGLRSQLDVQEAETIAAQAQSDIELYTTQLEQDKNALNLLVGAPLDAALLPASLDELDAGVAVIPADLPSNVLLRRPDVLEAEHLLIGANANIGAARAAYFPTISLTTAAGFASTALKTLFTHGAAFWSAAPSASIPIFGGPTRGNLEYAKAQQVFYVASYEKAVQSAFKDVADALARRETIGRQRAAQARLVAASEKSYRLADAQYRTGTSTFLNALTAQRTLYAARQTEIATVLADVSNRLALYRALAPSDAG